jgi:hypothetical protein
MVGWCRSTDPDYTSFEAISIALALNEQDTQSISDQDQAETAATLLNHYHHRSCAEWWPSLDGEGDWYVLASEAGTLSLFEALAISERYVRQELMLIRNEENQL